MSINEALTILYTNGKDIDYSATAISRLFKINSCEAYNLAFKFYSIANNVKD